MNVKRLFALSSFTIVIVGWIGDQKIVHEREKKLRTTQNREQNDARQ